MTAYTCRRCGATKPIREFNRKSKHGPWEPWNLARCKSCARELYLKRRGELATSAERHKRWRRGFFICPNCQQERRLSEFIKKEAAGPKRPWNLRYCRVCSHADYLERRKDPVQRRKQEEASRNWKKQNPERHAELAREYRRRHPEKIQAQNRLNYAVRMGRIERQPCEVCGVAEKVQAHHQSYEPDQWYNVRWLCKVCHKLEHGK